MARFSNDEYKDFTGGYNDVVTDYALKKTELRAVENYDIKKAIGGLSLREGTTIAPGIQTSYANEVTRRIEYITGELSRRVVVVDQNVILEGASSRDLLTGVNLDKPHFIQNSNVLYISDQSNLYEYGQKDYFSSVGTVDVLEDDIIQVSDDYPNSAIHGNFYQALSNLGSTDLSTEDYTVVANWEEVTDVQGFTSDVTRPVEAFDPSAAEVFTIQITSPATATGSIDITANGVTTTVAVTNGDTTSQVATNINAASYPGYTTTVNQNLVTFTADANEFRENPSAQFYDTGVDGIVDLLVNGADNNNILDSEVRKCQRIILHSKSLRYVATGNPDKPTTVYFSEPGQINYWKSTNQLVPTSSDGSIRATFNLVNSVVVSCNRTWWEYTGTDPEVDGTWKQLAIPLSAGCVSEWTIQILDYTNFIYLANDGLYVVSANILNQEGVPTQDTDAIYNVTSTKVDNTIRGIVDKTQCVSVFKDDIYYMAYNDNPEISVNNKVLCLFTDFRSFTQYTGWQVNDFLLNSDGVIEIASKNYSLLTENDAYVDVDVDTGGTKPMIPVLRSGRLTQDMHSHPKWYDKCFVHFTQNGDTEEGSVNFSVTIGSVEKDFGQLDVTPSLVWGRNWGAQWGLNTLLYYMAYVRRKGNWIQWEITGNTEGINVEFYSIEFQYKLLRKFSTNVLGGPISIEKPPE